MSVANVSNNERSHLLQPSNSNSADALATARALQILASGNFQLVQPTMPQTAPIGGIDASVLERTAQIIKMSSSQFPSGATSPQASVSPPMSDIVPLQGKLALTLEDGEYIGDVLNGVPHGRGTLTYHPAMHQSEYRGEWREGQFHGRGILILTKGDKMTGTWVNGSLEGEGLIEFEDGGKYQGAFIKGNYHGKGELRYASGACYKGDWENNEVHGQGIYKWSNGSYYSGGWLNGNGHGYGELNTDAMDYKGSWANGEYHGEGEVKNIWGGIEKELSETTNYGMAHGGQGVPQEEAERW